MKLAWLAVLAMGVAGQGVPGHVDRGYDGAHWTLDAVLPLGTRGVIFRVRDSIGQPMMIRVVYPTLSCATSAE